MQRRYEGQVIFFTDRGGCLEHAVRMVVETDTIVVLKRRLDGHINMQGLKWIWIMRRQKKKGLFQHHSQHKHFGLKGLFRVALFFVNYPIAIVKYNLLVTGPKFWFLVQKVTDPLYSPQCIFHV